MIQDDAPVRTSTLEAAVVAAAQANGGVFRPDRQRDAVNEILGRELGYRRLAHVLEAMCERSLALRIERGAYAVSDGLGRISPLGVGSHLVDDGFVSLWAAAAHHGLTTQDVMLVPVITVIRKARIEAPALDTAFVFHRTTPERLFGWREDSVDGVFARVADLERTLIDLVWFEGLAGTPEPAQVRAIWRAATRRVNPVVLVEYARRMGSSRFARRVGYLMEISGIEGAESLIGWREGRNDRIPLFRLSPSVVEPSKRWGISG